MTATTHRSRRLALLFGGPLSLCTAAVLVFFSWAFTVELPHSALSPSNIASVRVVAHDGSLLREVLSREDGRCRWVPLDQISPHLIQATLASEDQRFFSHGGVDPLALARALTSSLRQGRVVSGGSTLTMQLVRLVRPAPRTLGTKLREMVLAYKLDQRMSKEVVLWQYLNRAPYGNGTFGIEAAARRYLNKPAAHLSLAEAALLAALPRSPSGYNPFSHRERLLRRQRYILGLMAAQGRITPKELRLARRQPIALDAAQRPFQAPHMVQHVLALPLAARASWIRTTLDRHLQQRVEAAVQNTLFRVHRQGVTNAAVLVVENATGRVLAYVGSSDFFAETTSGQVDGTLALRQPGSTVKPFTYALALQQRELTAASLLRDLPARFVTDQGIYAPRNYDGTFHGPVRLRVALASSYNVPAVRTARRVGVQRLLDGLRAMGFHSLRRPARHYGLGLTLGNGEVSLHELVAAFATLARGGRYLPLRFIEQLRLPDGRSIDPSPPRGKRVLDRRVAYVITHILSDPLARVPAFGRNSALDLGLPSAVKTGTSKDFRDNWTVGYSPLYTVGVWVGNFDGSSMHNVSGISGAGPLWAEVMLAATGSRSPPFERPSGLVTRTICPLSGALVGPACEQSTEELFLVGSEPRDPCAFHQRIEQRTVVIYPPPYRAWAHARGLAVHSDHATPLHSDGENRRAARVRIRFPADGERFFVDPDLKRVYQNLPLEAVVQGSAREVRWLVDGRQVARAPFPYTARWNLETGRHSIVAQLPDGQRSKPVIVTVQ